MQIAEPRRQLKVFLPADLKPSLYLKKSDRFKAYDLGDIEKLRAFVHNCFNVNFLLQNIEDIGDIEAADLDHSDFVVFLPIGKSTLGYELSKCVDLGIPVIFIRHEPGMECELINFALQGSECFKNRPNCNGTRLKHCEGNYGKQLVFEDLTATIPKINKFFNLDHIPIFSMSFLIDFLIWYGNFGMPLRENRDKRIKAESEIILSAIKGLSFDIRNKIK